MSRITTHVLELAGGKPAAGVAVTLEREAAGGWQLVGRGVTDTDGRAKDLVAAGTLASGTYRLSFDVGDYYASRGTRTFYQLVPIQFVIEDASQHYHVPLLLSPFGYSTYRGS